MKLRAFSALALAAFAATTAVFAQDADKKPERAPTKPQSESASKTKTFATVAAGDGSVTKALKATDLDGLKKLIDKDATVDGKVVKVFSPSNNGIVILNFDRDYKKAISVALRPKDYAAFPDLKTLEGKRVLVSGKIEEYKGRLEIILSKPEQVQLVK